MRREHYFLIGLIIVTCFFYFQITKDLQSIPSCMYGCDYYYENGILISQMLQPTLADSSSHSWLGFTNSLPMASFDFKSFVAKLFGFEPKDAWRVNIGLGYVFIVLGIIFLYIFFQEVFVNPYLAVFLSFLTFNFAQMPPFKYSSMFIFVFAVWLVFLVKVKLSKLNIIVLIAFSVFLSNVHAMGFFIIPCFLFFYAIVVNKKEWKKYLLIGSSNIIICLLAKWWYRVIFIFHGDKNAVLFDVFPNLSIPSNFVWETFNSVKALFWNFSNWWSVIISLFVQFGLVAYFYTVFTKPKFYREKLLFHRFTTFIMLGCLTCMFSYLITVPVLGMALPPSKFRSFLLPFFTATMIGYLFMRSYYFGINKPLWRWIVICLAVCAVLMIPVDFGQTANAKFYKLGLEPVSERYSSIQEKIFELGPKEIVILTNNELSFALNGLTGVNTLAGRQSHFFHFGDFQKLWLDSTIFFYGNSTEKRAEILINYIKKANGKKLYVYWDQDWDGTEWINESGDVFPYDPFRFQYSKEVVSVLHENGIRYVIEQDGVFEPSGRDKAMVTRMDIVHVLPPLAGDRFAGFHKSILEVPGEVVVVYFFYA